MLTEAVVKEIRSLTYTEHTLAEVMQKYGLTENTARNLLNERTYRQWAVGKRLPKQKYRRILVVADVEAIMEALKHGYWGQQQHLAEQYRVSRNTIQRIANGTW